MNYFVKLHLVLLCLYSLNTYSKSDNFLAKIPCTNQTLEAVGNFGTPEKWSKTSESTVSSPLEEGGEVRLQVEGNKSLVTMNNSSVEVGFSFTMPECSVVLLKSKFIGSGFSDDDLTKLMKKNKKGIILVWSAHMSLSVYELVELQEYISELGVPVKVLADLNSLEEISKKIIGKYKLPKEYLEKMNSRKLEKFGINIHYPSMVLYKNSKLIVRVPGYNNKIKLQALIKKYLE
ncbi:hypothetical protein [Halobacteriovorax sp. HLS]|uniref:hypothetical protein n=1 Tax=Halobacteriovorax sp. HLS TaxID=2234000 RepID=UPI000FD8305E|nr:hypothetical protein [Halobacteriovorax sp. HLS]